MAAETENGIPLQRLSLASEDDVGSEESRLVHDDPDPKIFDGIPETSLLPPQDRGLGAWKVLLGCWLLEISWGVLKNRNLCPYTP
jgi:hypothetical protein